MTKSVSGVVRQLGRNYADGTLWLEIHIPIEKAGHLPLQIGSRVPVTLRVGGMEYMAGLRSTKKNKYAWVCPDVYLPTGERLTLGRVLTDEALRPNDRVQLTVQGSVIALRPEQQGDKKLPGLERYRFVDAEAATFNGRFSRVLTDVDLETLSPRSPDSMLRALRDVAGIYFWTMRIGSFTYKIYVGKTKSLPRRLSDYTNEFQIHAPNDYKLRFFQSFIRNREPTAAFDLYFVKGGVQGYTLDETEAVKEYGPLINERAETTSEDREVMKQAFAAHYSGIFTQKLVPSE